MQPILISMMPRTIRPAMPAYLFVAVALLAATAAFRADSIATAWPSSTIARRLRASPQPFHPRPPSHG
jgi:hypothetical protein